MKKKIPNHRENEATLATESLQQFEADASENHTPQKASPRPVDRPRVIPTPDEIAGEIDANNLQIFDMEAMPAPPGTKARPRPEGRQRSGTGELPSSQNLQPPANVD